MIDSPIVSKMRVSTSVTKHCIVHLMLLMTTLLVSFFLPPYQADAEGLVLQCIDRMLRPPCLDVGAGAIISEGKFLAAREGSAE